MFRLSVTTCTWSRLEYLLDWCLGASSHEHLKYSLTTVCLKYCISVSSCVCVFHTCCIFIDEYSARFVYYNMSVVPRLYIGPQTVRWATDCILGYSLYVGPQTVYWATACTLGHRLYIGLQTVRWATDCTLGQTLYWAHVCHSQAMDCSVSVNST